MGKDNNYISSNAAFGTVSDCGTEGGCADQSKRDFVVMASAGLGAVGVCAAVWPAIDSMNPSADVLAQSSIEVDISSVPEGDQKKVMWRGMPIFIYHRTQAQIDEARNVDASELKDVETDDERVIPGMEKWLVVVGVCTHLGCVPQANQGEYNGWFCSCHGSQYDSSARIRKGPAPTNLPIPPYAFLSDTKIFIGDINSIKDASVRKHNGTLA